MTPGGRPMGWTRPLTRADYSRHAGLIPSLVFAAHGWNELTLPGSCRRVAPPPATPSREVRAVGTPASSAPKAENGLRVGRRKFTCVGWRPRKQGRRQGEAGTGRSDSSHRLPPRVLVATKYDRRFEPRNRCRSELATSRCGSERVRAQAAFPAAAQRPPTNTRELLC
jgi:hypothetical protein